MRRLLILFCAVFTLYCVVFASPGLALTAEVEMTYEEYEAQLAEYKQREADAKEQIDKLSADIESITAEIKSLEKRIAAVQREIYDLIESDEEGVRRFISQLDALSGQIRGLSALSSDELFWKQDEIEELEGRFAELKESRIRFLPEASEKIAGIESAFSQLKASIPELPSPGEYIVVVGDNLWRISGREEVYDDSYMWPRIYRANRDKIKDPDLIYPKQILTYPRGVKRTQYLVGTREYRGESLYSIAMRIYNDPTKWRRIYEANRTQIFNPNLIYPAQVLDIPPID